MKRFFFFIEIKDFLEIFHPNSFKSNVGLCDDLVDFNYYSFVTLTTVGYGDILAITRVGRALSIFEAITGQLYLAIMSSRLVGLHASSQSRIDAER